MAIEPKLFQNIDEKKVLGELVTLNTLPTHAPITPTSESPARGIKTFPTIIIGPWTAVAKEIKLQQTWQESGDKFLADSMARRNYTPKEIIDRVAQETIERGHLLTDGTIRALKVFWGTEARIGDFTRAGLEVVTGGDPEAIVLRWGWEESRHKRLIMAGLVLSGVVSPIERLRMEQEAIEVKWDPRSHPGLYSEYGYIYYGIRQEGDTGANYRELRRLVRADYGLPLEKTVEEKVRGYEIGFSGLIEPIPVDEFAHRGMYQKLFQGVLRYKPEKAADVIQRVDPRYKMPMLNFFEDSGLVAKLLYPEGNTAIARAQRKTAMDSYAILGFADRHAPANMAKQLTILESSVTAPSFALLLPDGTLNPVSYE